MTWFLKLTRLQAWLEIFSLKNLTPSICYTDGVYFRILNDYKISCRKSWRAIQTGECNCCTRAAAVGIV